MAWRRTLFCSILLSASLAEQPAQAAGCIYGHPSVEQEFQDAKFVVLGRVAAIKKNVPVRLPYKNGTYKSRVMIQTVSISKHYKGPLKRTITYSDEYSSAQFPMILGKEYILFYRQDGHGEMFIDVCGNSQEMSRDSKLLLHKIGQLSRGGH
jgi:hypothetical protein